MLITWVIRKLRSTKIGEKKDGAKPVRPRTPCEHQGNMPDSSRSSIPPDGDEVPLNRPCPQCKAEERETLKYRWKLNICLALPYALQALDVTIVASALPWIAVDFGEISQLNWIISAFNLTLAAFVPFWGQIADIFGRHWALQMCSLVMLVGSALCTGVPTNAFGAFLLGRALQGVACAGLNTIVRVVLADKVTLRGNAKNWSAFALTGGICYGIGPVLGGFLTSVNWRWCFAINLPIAFVGILVIFIFLRNDLLGPQPIPEIDEDNSGRREKLAKRLSTIDIGGQLLFLFGLGLIILAFTWAGATYDWNHPAVLVPLIFGALMACSWLYYEYSLRPGGLLYERLSFQRPMMPWNVIRNRNVNLLGYIHVATGMATYSVLYFVEIYFTLVKGNNSDEAGTQLLFYTPGLAVGTILSIQLCNTWPRRTFPPLFFAALIQTVGVGLLAWALYFEHTPTIYGMMGLTGVGVGLQYMPGSLHSVGFFPNNIATVISVLSVAGTLGGTLALTVMSTVFNNTSGISYNSAFQSEQTNNVPDEVKERGIEAVKNGIVWAFVALTPFMVMSVVAASCLGNVTITKGSNTNTSTHDVIHGSYLLSLFRNKGESERNRNPQVEEMMMEEPKEPRAVQVDH
ncbi:MFS general substrate transporter [Hypoxylon sp. FL1284]|nr:MFS general substrate transporter [Hypoxylon sp. FL1284]